ncbi:MAG TPA: phosphoenolpyruvate--protein phosphotransferase, partial [Polyangiaceae bacterium]|nr:phosphoenolpyruvate--protein phosphotransferase [Polyangiaceae bacterium]
IYHSRVAPEVPCYRIDPDAVELEKERLVRAVQGSIDELEQVRQRVLADIGEAEAEIIAAHRALIADPAFVLKLRKRIERELVNAELAIEREADDMTGLLASSVSAYLRERAHDVLDVKLRLLKHLGHGAASMLEQLPPGAIVVARQLLPSDTLRLDRAHVAGLALEYGAPTGHAAILARSMGIPAVGDIPGLLERVRDGVSLLVDGERGDLVLDPEPSQVVSFGMVRDSYDLATAGIVGDEWRACTTSDGVDITLLANVGRLSEVDQVRRHYLQGVGLFRTEYLFLQSEEPPGLESQREVYRAVLDELKDLPIVIRTLDLGGDKTPRFPMPELRGMRSSTRGLSLSLAERELFTTQLQAIMEAASGPGDVAILLPMVVCADDFKRATAAIDEVATRLGRSSRPPVGAMIETPSALFELNELLDVADFISLGTNDLVQFMLATERRSTGALAESAFFQPSILRAVEHVVHAATTKGKSLTVCGEAAGDPMAACLLVGMGARRLSMSPVRAARVRDAIRRHNCSALQTLARRAAECSSRSEVMALVKQGVSLD